MGQSRHEGHVRLYARATRGRNPQLAAELDKQIGAFRLSRSLSSSVRFMTVEGKLNGEKFVEFLGRLLHNSRRPIFLIVDGHPAHRAAVVKRFVESSQGRLRLFYLPSYSPELNPDESVWRHLKTHNLGRARITGPDDLKRQALIVLRRLKKTPALVKAFFKGPNVRYALA